MNTKGQGSPQQIWRGLPDITTATDERYNRKPQQIWRGLPDITTAAAASEEPEHYSGGGYNDGNGGGGEFTIEDYCSMLMAIPCPDSRKAWFDLSCAAKSAGVDFATWDAWSQTGGGYDTRGNRDTWISIEPATGQHGNRRGELITADTLLEAAINNGWKRK